MSQVAVTGASGFLGRAVVAALRAAGLAVLAVGRSEAPGVVRVDDYRACPAADVLIHLAEPRDRASVADDDAAAAVSVTDALVARGYGRIVYASSTAVYGPDGARPFTVDDPPGADDPYARMKLACEDRVIAAGGIVLRLSNLYGPGMAANNVLSDILAQVPGQGPLVVRDAAPERDFLHVGDAAEAFVRAVRAPAEVVGRFNVAAGLSVSVGALAAAVGAAAGEGGRPVESRQPPSRPSRVRLDIRRTAAVLGWSPRTTLEDGLAGLLAQEEGKSAPCPAPSRSSPATGPSTASSSRS